MGFGENGNALAAGNSANQVQGHGAGGVFGERHLELAFAENRGVGCGLDRPDRRAAVFRCPGASSQAGSS